MRIGNVHARATDLGSLLLFFGLVTPSELAAAKDMQRCKGGRLGGHIVRLGIVDEPVLVGFLAEIYQIPAIRLSDFTIDAEVVRVIPEEYAWTHDVIAVNREGSTFIVAMADPTDAETIAEVGRLSNAAVVEVVLVGVVDLAHALRQHYPVA